MQNSTSGIPEGTPINAANLQNAVDSAVDDAFEEQAPILRQQINSAVDAAFDSSGNPIPFRHEDYRITPESMWPPPVFVRKNIGPHERFYLEHRWYAQWAFFDKKASINKRNYHSLQFIIGVGSVTVPVLVGIRDDRIQDALYLVTVFISLAVAIAAAIENINKYGDNWRSYRQAAEDLKQEKSLYDVRAGRYADHPSPFTRFVERTEEIVAQQNGRWVQSVERQQAQAAEQAQDILEGAEDDEDILTSAEHYRYGTRTTTSSSRRQAEAAVPIASIAPEPYSPAAEPDMVVQVPPATDYVEPPVTDELIDYSEVGVDNSVVSTSDAVEPIVGVQTEYDPALGATQPTTPIIDDPNYTPDIG